MIDPTALQTAAVTGLITSAVVAGSKKVGINKIIDPILTYGGACLGAGLYSYFIQNPHNIAQAVIFALTSLFTSHGVDQTYSDVKQVVASPSAK